jgi:hypothetical protein
LSAAHGHAPFQHDDEVAWTCIRRVSERVCHHPRSIDQADNRVVGHVSEQPRHLSLLVMGSMLK